MRGNIRGRSLHLLAASHHYTMQSCHHGVANRRDLPTSSDILKSKDTEALMNTIQHSSIKIVGTCMQCWSGPCCISWQMKCCSKVAGAHMQGRDSQQQSKQRGEETRADESCWVFAGELTSEAPLMKPRAPTICVTRPIRVKDITKDITGLQ